MYADLYFEHKNTTPRVHQPNDSSGSEDDFEDIDEVVAAFREARLRHELVEDAVYENPLSVEKPSRSFTKNAAVKPKLEDSPKRAPREQAQLPAGDQFPSALHQKPQQARGAVLRHHITNASFVKRSGA